MKHKMLDTMDLIPNVETIIFESLGRMKNQVQDDIEKFLFSNRNKTAYDCEKEYDETNDNYKRSLDIPTSQAMIDMACSDPGYLELNYWRIKEDRSNCCINPISGMKVKNPEAGRMDLCHFTELCVPVRDRLYRLELKTGREIPKHKDIEWLKAKIGCTFQEADEFKTAFELLNLDQKVVYKIIFGEHKNDNGIQDTGNKYLEDYKNLSIEMEEFKLEPLKTVLYSEDEEGNDIDEMWLNTLDPEVMEMNFKEDLPVDSNVFTMKRLSIPEESLTEEEIAAIREASYEEYKKINNKYMEKKFIFTGKDQNGKNMFRTIGKKIDDLKIKSAISMAWSYLTEAKERFNNEKDRLVNETMEEGVSDPVYDAIECYKTKPTRSAKYRLTINIHGGEWDGEKIPKATPGEIEIMWRVINGKM